MRGPNVQARYDLTNTSGSLAAICGTQVGGNVLEFFHYTDLDRLRDSLGSTTTDDATLRFYLESVSGHLTFKNQSDSRCWMTIYDLVSRVDGNGVSYNPYSAWSAGMTELGAVGTAGTLMPHSTPFQSATFNQFWAVRKRVRVGMESGATHKHSYKFSPNRYLDTARIRNAGAYYVKGLSCAVMVVIHGEPANGTVASGSDSTVTLAPVKVDYVGTRSFKYKYLNENRRKYQATNSLSNTIAVEGMQDTGIGAAPMNVAN